MQLTRSQMLRGVEVRATLCWNGGRGVSALPRRPARTAVRARTLSAASQRPLYWSALTRWPLQSCRSSSDDWKETAPEPAAVEATHLLTTVTACGVGAGLLYLLTSSQVGIAFRASLMASWLGRSGFIAALSLIFLSEIGDKTFFICAILAMRLGRWISFLGTVLALGLMTVCSVGLGVAFTAIPDAMRTSIPLGRYLSVALFAFFGIRSILTSAQSTVSDAEGERLDAEEAVAAAVTETETRSEGHKEQSAGIQMSLRSLFVVAALVFVAEWGDRSMLTTIALGASQSPLGVALGGIIGHTMAAIIAVLGGSFISNFISEKTVNLVSGILFIIFAIASALNWA